MIRYNSDLSLPLGIENKMPTILVNGVNLFYKESGSGPETIVFSHGLLMDHSMFEPQRAVFEKQYRAIAYDHRAQGLSDDPGYRRRRRAPCWR